MKITNRQLRQIIREELNKKKSLNEGISKDTLRLYGYAGIQTKYKDEYMDELKSKFGAKAIEEAQKLAPQYIAFAKKVKAFLDNPLVDDFAKIAAEHSSYGGGSAKPNTSTAVQYILARMK